MHLLLAILLTSAVFESDTIVLQFDPAAVVAMQADLGGAQTATAGPGSVVGDTVVVGLVDWAPAISNSPWTDGAYTLSALIVSTDGVGNVTLDGSLAWEVTSGVPGMITGMDTPLAPLNLLAVWYKGAGLGVACIGVSLLLRVLRSGIRGSPEL